MRARTTWLPTIAIVWLAACARPSSNGRGAEVVEVLDAHAGYSVCAAVPAADAVLDAGQEVTVLVHTVLGGGCPPDPAIEIVDESCRVSPLADGSGFAVTSRRLQRDTGKPSTLRACTAALTLHAIHCGTVTLREAGPTTFRYARGDLVVEPGAAASLLYGQNALNVVCAGAAR